MYEGGFGELPNVSYESHELLNHAHGVLPPHFSRTTYPTAFLPNTPFTPTLPEKESGYREMFTSNLGLEPDPSPFSRTSSNLFLEADPDLNRDYNNTDDPLLYLSTLSGPKLLAAPQPLNTNQLISGSSNLSSVAGSSSTSSLPSGHARMGPMGTCSTIPQRSTVAQLDAHDPESERNGHIAIAAAPTLTCTACLRVFASKRTLERHAETHIRTRFPCPKGYAKSFTLKKDADRHVRNIHEGQAYRCDTCGCTRRKDNLKRHMEICRDSKQSRKQPRGKYDA